MLNLNFERGSHVCHLYQGADDFKEVALSFVRNGLRNGECCRFVTDEADFDDWLLEFQAYGIDVQAMREAGALTIVAADGERRLAGSGSIVTAREILARIEQSLGNFTGVRFAGDSDWMSMPAVAPEQLCHWEATTNFLFPESEVRAICQYNLDRYAPEFIHAALRTHPIVLYQGQRFESPFYEAPEILEQEPRLNVSSNDPRMVAEMLAKLVSTHH